MNPRVFGCRRNTRPTPCHLATEPLTKHFEATRIFDSYNGRYHGNSVSSIRDRRLTTWPPSPVPFRRGKLEYLKLVPKTRGASSKRLPKSNQPIHQITTRSYSHCTLVELNRCHCAVKMHKRLKFSKTIDSNKSNVLSNPGFKRFGI